jgi:hypothetical protein
MNDERREVYTRLVRSLLALSDGRTASGRWVRMEDVIGLLATELLTERRGQGSQTENKEPEVGYGPC